MALLVQHVGAKSQARPAVHGGRVRLGRLPMSLLLYLLLLRLLLLMRRKPRIGQTVPLRYHRRQLRHHIKALIDIFDVLDTAVSTVQRFIELRRRCYITAASTGMMSTSIGCCFSGVGTNSYADHLFVWPMLKDVTDFVTLLLDRSILIS